MNLDIKKSVSLVINLKNAEDKVIATEFRAWVYVDEKMGGRWEHTAQDSEGEEIDLGTNPIAEWLYDNIDTLTDGMEIEVAVCDICESISHPEQMARYASIDDCDIIQVCPAGHGMMHRKWECLETTYGWLLWDEKFVAEGIEEEEEE